MENSQYTEISLPIKRNSILEKTNTIVGKSVLIMEDDHTLQPLWELIFLKMSKAIQVDWTSKAEEASALISCKFKSGQPYSLVIADIFLEGEKTGIDIWNNQRNEVTHFVFTSEQPISHTLSMDSVGYRYPPYFQKPLSFDSCLQIANLLKLKSEYK